MRCEGDDVHVNVRSVKGTCRWARCEGVMDVQVS